MRNNHGLTLIEVLISAVISVFIILTLFVLLRSSQNRLAATVIRSREQQIANVLFSEIKSNIRSKERIYSLAEYVDVAINSGEIEKSNLISTNQVFLINGGGYDYWKGWMINVDHLLLENQGGSGGVVEAGSSTAWVPFHIGSDTVYVVNGQCFQLQATRKSLVIDFGGIRLSSSPNDTLYTSPFKASARLSSWR